MCPRKRGSNGLGFKFEPGRLVRWAGGERGRGMELL